MSKIEDEAKEFRRKREAQKKQRYRMRQRGKAAASTRDGNRPQLIQIWVCDPEAWRAIHGVDERASLVGITEAEIFKQCKRYRNMEVDEVWGRIGAEYIWEEVPKPASPRTVPRAMTEEQEEMAGDEGIIFIEGDDGKGLHPGTWGGRRVRTNRNRK
jgi:hypothetical protein